MNEAKRLMLAVKCCELIVEDRKRFRDCRGVRDLSRGIARIRTAYLNRRAKDIRVGNFWNLPLNL